MKLSLFPKCLPLLSMLQKTLRVLALYVCWRSVIRLRVTDFERFLRLLAKYYYICWRFTFASATTAANRTNLTYFNTYLYTFYTNNLPIKKSTYRHIFQFLCNFLCQPMLELLTFVEKKETSCKYLTMILKANRGHFVECGLLFSKYMYKLKICYRIKRHNYMSMLEH